MIQNCVKICEMFFPLNRTKQQTAHRSSFAAAGCFPFQRAHTDRGFWECQTGSYHRWFLQTQLGWWNFPVRQVQKETFHYVLMSRSLTFDTVYRCCSYFGLFMCGHPKEGHEDHSVNGALYVGDLRRGRQHGKVEATRGVTQVWIQAPL